MLSIVDLPRTLRNDRCCKGAESSVARGAIVQHAVLLLRICYLVDYSKLLSGKYENDMLGGWSMDLSDF